MLAALCLMPAGCSQSQSSPQLERPDIAPATQPSFAGTLELDASHITPIYREMLPVDLASVVRVAVADSLDIAEARVQVEAGRGRLESTIGSAFPAIVPTALFDHVEGTVRATEGNLVGVGFNTF
ncbi:MAG: hypothetical protein IID40_03025, partial [Planctomycetes bacterium]|nr:hypothetical protein [Planctomycetota bacterium]